MHDEVQLSVTYLLFKRLDFNLVVIDRGTIGEGELPCMRSVRKSWLNELPFNSLQRLLDRRDRQGVLIEGGIGR